MEHLKLELSAREDQIAKVSAELSQLKGEKLKLQSAMSELLPRYEELSMLHRRTEDEYQMRADAYEKKIKTLNELVENQYKQYEELQESIKIEKERLSRRSQQEEIHFKEQQVTLEQLQYEKEKLSREKQDLLMQRAVMEQNSQSQKQELEKQLDLLRSELSKLKTVKATPAKEEGLLIVQEQLQQSRQKIQQYEQSCMSNEILIKSLTEKNSLLEVSNNELRERSLQLQTAKENLSRQLESQSLRIYELESSSVAAPASLQLQQQNEELRGRVRLLEAQISEFKLQNDKILKEIMSLKVYEQKFNEVNR